MIFRIHQISIPIQVVAVNEEACKIAKGIAYPAGGLVAGCICETSLYLPDKKKELVKDQVKKQLEVFKDQEVDLIICEVGLWLSPYY